MPGFLKVGKVPDQVDHGAVAILPFNNSIRYLVLELRKNFIIVYLFYKADGKDNELNHFMVFDKKIFKIFSSHIGSMRSYRGCT